MFPKEKQIAQTLHFHHLLQGFLRQVGFGHLLRDIVSSRRVTSGTSVLHYVPPLNQTHNNLHEVDKLVKTGLPKLFPGVKSIGQCSSCHTRVISQAFTTG